VPVPVDNELSNLISSTALSRGGDVLTIFLDSIFSCSKKCVTRLDYHNGTELNGQTDGDEGRVDFLSSRFRDSGQIEETFSGRLKFLLLLLLFDVGSILIGNL
jgi:hypothetical protein